MTISTDEQIKYAEAQIGNGFQSTPEEDAILDSLRRLKLIEAEVAEIRGALAGQDYASLPSDFSTARMAHTIRAERDKFMDQVRHTCARAEKAEAKLKAIEEAEWRPEPVAWTVSFIGKNTPRYLSWNREPIGLASKEQCVFKPLYGPEALAYADHWRERAEAAQVDAERYRHIRRTKAAPCDFDLQIDAATRQGAAFLRKEVDRYSAIAEIECNKADHWRAIAEKLQAQVDDERRSKREQTIDEARKANG